MSVVFSANMPIRPDYVSVGDGVSVPLAAVMAAPHINWDHIDGPLMTWAGRLDWLTWRERFRLWMGWTTVEDLADARWNLWKHRQLGTALVRRASGKKRV